MSDESTARTTESTEKRTDANVESMSAERLVLSDDGDGSATIDR